MRLGLETEPGCPDTGQLRASGLRSAFTSAQEPHHEDPSSPSPTANPHCGRVPGRQVWGSGQHSTARRKPPRRLGTGGWGLGTSYCPHWTSTHKKEISECHLDLTSTHSNGVPDWLPCLVTEGSLRLLPGPRSVDGEEGWGVWGAGPPPSLPPRPQLPVSSSPRDSLL